MSSLLRHAPRTRAVCMLRARPLHPPSSTFLAALPLPVPSLPPPACGLLARRHFSSSASAATSSTAAPGASTPSNAATPSNAPITDGRVPPPQLLFARPFGVDAADGGSASAASCSLQSRAHLASLDASTRSRLFELTFLGTASGRASLTRIVSSLALRMGRTSRLSLFDCGEGTTRQVQRCSHLHLATLAHVFITHMHGDHVLGLCSLLASMDKIKNPSPALAARPLHIFGPLGIAQFVRFNLEATHSWISRPIVFHELLKNDVRASSLPSFPDVVYHQNPDVTQLSMQIYEDSSMVVHASPLKHRSLSCWGYVVTERLPATPHPGETRLARGRKLAVLGDTCNSAGLIDVAMDADVMVHEATYLEKDAVKGLPFMKGHSSAGMAGAFARTCNAQHLLLTHFSQRYVGAAATPAAAVAATAPHVEQASQTAGHKRVYAAQDLQVFHVAAHLAPQEPGHKTSTKAQAIANPRRGG